MKKIIAFTFLLSSLWTSAQSDERITTLQFVQVIDNHLDEALYYYKNNWKELRDEAMNKSFIASFEFVRTERTTDYPIDIILLTTYTDQNQFERREENFSTIMEGRKRDLLNEIEPAAFRKTLFVKEKSTHSFK